MATWNSRGLRGSTLEDLVNRTNEQYREKGLALIQKIPTPITPVRMDKENRHITLAYFEQRSTVDYIGAVQGIPSALMPKNVRRILFRLRISILIRWNLCRHLKSREGWLFFLYSTAMKTSSITLHCAVSLLSGTGCRKAAARASGAKNWSLSTI